MPVMNEECQNSLQDGNIWLPFLAAKLRLDGKPTCSQALQLVTLGSLVPNPWGGQGGLCGRSGRVATEVATRMVAMPSVLLVGQPGLGQGWRSSRAELSGCFQLWSYMTQIPSVWTVAMKSFPLAVPSHESTLACGSSWPMPGPSLQTHCFLTFPGPILFDSMEKSMRCFLPVPSVCFPSDVTYTSFWFRHPMELYFGITISTTGSGTWYTQTSNW